MKHLDAILITSLPKWKRQSITFNKVIRGRPTSECGHGEGLLIGQRVGELLNQLGNPKGSGGGSRRWDPVGGTREERKPIGCSAADEDPMNGILELPKQGVGGGVI